MVEDAMSLQYALFQVMRLLTEKAVDTKRAALLLYALQIAASNLKRLHEETQEITRTGDMANEKSLMKELLEVLQIPETEAERMAEEHAAAMERDNPPSGTYTIKACAADTVESPIFLHLPWPQLHQKCSTFVPIGALMPVNASKKPCYTFCSLR